jgi:tRNA dimethylallyltransferase
LPLVVIVGPTAAGKSALALRLAQQFGGEIVSADSRQIYRQMDVGTAKPSPEEQALVPHHMIDVVDPDGEYTLAHFQAAAYRAIAEIHARGRLPLLVGGTGLYVRAVVEGLRIPAVPPQPDLRAALEARARAEGHEALLADLAARDPLAAARIDPRNIRRVIRAIEVCEVSGRPFSSFQESDPPPYRVLTLGVRADREALYARIDARVDAMIAAGLVAENERLVARGYGYDLPAMSGLGYRQIGMYLRGEIALPRAIEILKFETHRFARQQHAWFRESDPRITWLAPDEHDKAFEMLKGYVKPQMNTDETR